MTGDRFTGIASALGAAALFGASTPFAKLLLDVASPPVLAAILYIGSGLGLAGWIALRPRQGTSAPFARSDWPWIAAAILAGGDAATLACLKGLVAGGVNLAIAFAVGAPLPAPAGWVGAGLLGFLGYGVSLTLFIVALRHLGTARTGAYFSVAPFFGAVLALAVLGERPGIEFWAAGALMALGIWLHLSERHEHPHVHAEMTHTHPHVHDTHHQHAHDFAWDGRQPYVHVHRHERLVHSHPHYPDLHHRHGH